MIYLLREERMTTDFSQIESSIVDVKKYNGRITAFNKEKITNMICIILSSVLYNMWVGY
jgi:hypothetical protein